MQTSILTKGLLTASAFLFSLSATLTPLLADEGTSEKRTFLVSSHHPDQIAIVDESGQKLWAIGAENGVVHPQDAAALEDGSVFFSVSHGAKMVRISDKELLWSYATPEGAENPVAQPLGDDLFLVGNEGPCCLLEINSASEVLRRVQVNDSPFQGSHGQFRFCRKTETGTYLFPMINAGVLREYNADGARLRDIPVSAAPVGAIQLPNGDVLSGAGSAVEQFDANNQLVWRFDAIADGGLKSGLITAVSRLKNGNTLVGIYHDDPEQPDIIEISPDKKVVFQLTLADVGLVAAVELLDGNFRPSSEIQSR